MKAIIVKNTLVDIGGVSLPLTRICADSAVSRDTMPLFVPGLSLGWYARVCPAFRISRLGKHIPARFATRYTDAVTAVCLLCASDTGFISSGLASIIDSAVTTGRFSPWSPSDTVIAISVGDSAVTVDTNDIDLSATISRVSDSTTLKSGDLLIFEDLGLDLPLTPGSHIRADIADTCCLDLKVR